MRAVFLIGTLKRQGLSNTQVLCEFLAEKMTARQINCEMIRLVDHVILPGTYASMGESDEWPAILKKIEAADIVIFATPIWWSGHSSEIQRVIERLDEVHDEILQGKQSRLYGKIGGIVITGDSDGAQHIIGNIGNFFNAIGMVLPPYATLSVLWSGQRKGADTTREALFAQYQEEYQKTADTMVDQLMKYAEMRR